MSKKNKYKTPRRKKLSNKTVFLVAVFTLIFYSMYKDEKRQERSLEKFKIEHNCIKKEI